ncbi:MAG: amino acid transporter [Planctomycetaceae bacterium]
MATETGKQAQKLSESSIKLDLTPGHTEHAHQTFWVWVLCLTGVDYFSTLGYQPSIAFESTGRLSPLATIILVLVTLLGAVPVYRHVAQSSPHGQGSIGMLERLVHGWTGKLLVLVLLGFAATDFVITKTLSAADAAEHLIHNPFWNKAPELLHHQMFVTMTLLVALGVTFLRGFKEVIGIAVVIVGTYLFLNVILLGSALYYLATHPSHLQDWWNQVFVQTDWRIAHSPLQGHDWITIVLLCLLFFPKLALGLSGFETGVIVMALIKGTGETPEEQLKSRVRDAKKLLLTAALIMCTLLLASSLVTATLIAPEELRAPEGGDPGGRAANRALAYLAHGEGSIPISPLFGHIFGTIYDISTVVILWFAGASAMSGLLNLTPQYLPRYGMAPEWARAVRPLVFLFTAINLFVTWVFNADVADQGDAYATGVVVLMLSAAFATVIEIWRERTGSWWRRLHWGYALVTFVFLYTTVAIIIEKPAGMKIAGCFIAAVLFSSFFSRTMRSTELRFTGFRFKDDHSKFLWDSMRHIEFPVLVPHRPGRRGLEDKEESMREEHHLTPDIPLVFIEAQRGDVSEFYQSPMLEVTEKEGRITLRITGVASIAHVIAAVALELSKVGKPPEIHFGWSDETPLAANIGFVLFGEGNVPWMVRELIIKAEPDPARQPRVVVG